MTDKGPAILPWPPIIFVAALALAGLLTTLFPLPWFAQPFSDILLAVGVLLIIGGGALAFSAARTLSKHRTTIMAHRAAEHLVTSGPFALSRNPIYLGMIAVLIGVALVAHSAWFVATALPAGVGIGFAAIRPEERQLAQKFGKRYRDYAKNVRRWI